MMQIRCPHCGDRPEAEFRCGGTTGIARAPLDADDIAWGEYLFFRDNPHGLHAERWLHHFGCGQWFNLLRDTHTHENQAVCAITVWPVREGAA
jgi:sarcosine oxidase subunit delta